MGFIESLRGKTDNTFELTADEILDALERDLRINPPSDIDFQPNDVVGNIEPDVWQEIGVDQAVTITGLPEEVLGISEGILYNPQSNEILLPDGEQVNLVSSSFENGES